MKLGQYILNGIVLVGIVLLALRFFDPPSALSISNMANREQFSGFPGRWNCDKLGTLDISPDLEIEGIGKLTLANSTYASADLSKPYRGIWSKKITLLGSGKTLAVKFDSAEDHCFH